MRTIIFVTWPTNIANFVRFFVKFVREKLANELRKITTENALFIETPILYLFKQKSMLKCNSTLHNWDLLTPICLPLPFMETSSSIEAIKGITNYIKIELCPDY